MEPIKLLPKGPLSKLRPRPLDLNSPSTIWQCQRHGQFRIYVSGAIAPFA